MEAVDPQALSKRLHGLTAHPAVRIVMPLVITAIASGTLYVLLPADLGGNYTYFFVVYIAAVALGILSHAPGGIGVFEASLIAGLGVGARPDLLAALILYRLVYFFLPFLTAALGLGLAWATARLRPRSDLILVKT